MIEIETKYAVNLFFPNPAFLQIYFEAVANALDAGANEINIDISTDGQISPEYLEITISDNGIGLTDERFERFRRVKEPTDRFHKGLGRLVYLQYFSTINVTSVFEGKKRKFSFSDTFTGDSKISNTTASDQRGTVLRFSGFLGDRLKSYDDLRPGVLKSKILEQFLPTFHTKKKAEDNFKISITLDTSEINKQKDFFPDSQSITLTDIPEFIDNTFLDISIHAYTDITISYMIKENWGKNLQLTAVCIDGRTIPLKKLLHAKAIPFNYSAIFLIESDLFIGKSDSSRQRLTLPDDIPEAILYKTLRRKISSILSENIPEIEEKNKKTTQQFEDRYPHLTGLFEKDTVGVIDKDEAIENAQRLLFVKQKEILESDSLSDALFEKSLDISARTLTEYILYREFIIKKLSELTAENREDEIHDLIVPRYKHFKEKNMIDGIYKNNAWILDDKFMSFREIFSEGKMKQVISAITMSEDSVNDDGRPDISMIFSADPEQAEKVEVVVVELKRRKIDEKDSLYVQTQLLKRARKLLNHCPNIQRVWYFGIIEIDDALSELLQDSGYTPLYSKGKVFYKDFAIKHEGVPVPTPICLLSYDAVIKDAAARNHTFLELLKHDIKTSTISIEKANH